MIAQIYCHFQCSRGKFQLEIPAGALRLTVNHCCHSHSSLGKVPPNLINKGMTAQWGSLPKENHTKSGNFSRHPELSQILKLFDENSPLGSYSFK
jgi:hypothetical protein